MRTPILIPRKNLNDIHNGDTEDGKQNIYSGDEE